MIDSVADVAGGGVQPQLRPTQPVSGPRLRIDVYDFGQVGRSSYRRNSAKFSHVSNIDHSLCQNDRVSDTAARPPLHGKPNMEHRRTILRACSFCGAPGETRNDPGVEVLPSQSLTTIGARND
jgi:hypothetical protein